MSEPLPQKVNDEIQDMLNELENKGLPYLEDGDLTREMISERFGISINGARNRAKEMIKKGKWLQVDKRTKNGNKIITYKKVV
jgi:predicted HTH transcriptional regulator